MTEQVYTLVQAAKVAGVSLPTVRRRKGQLIEAGAVVDPKGWVIPHTALAYAFPDVALDPKVAIEKPQEPRQATVEAEVVEPDTDELRDAQDRARRLESENRVLEAQVERWQAVAGERLDALNDQRLAFRALAMTQQQQLEPPKPQPADEPARESWVRRWFG